MNRGVLVFRLLQSISCLWVVSRYLVGLTGGFSPSFSSCFLPSPASFIPSGIPAGVSVVGTGSGVSSVDSPQPIMNVDREATANAVAAYFVYFFNILLFGFSLTGSINRLRRRSDRANLFCGKDSGYAIPLPEDFQGSSVRVIPRYHASLGGPP